ncbi:MAG: hypothetical protein AAFX06_03550 [Planctomycetota bacterium]
MNRSPNPYRPPPDERADEPLRPAPRPANRTFDTFLLVMLTIPAVVILVGGVVKTILDWVRSWSV